MVKRIFELSCAGNFRAFSDFFGRNLARAEESNIYVPLRRKGFEVLQEPEKYFIKIMIGGDLRNGDLTNNQISNLMEIFDEYKAESENTVRLNGNFGNFDSDRKLMNYFFVENIIGSNVA